MSRKAFEKWCNANTDYTYWEVWKAAQVGESEETIQRLRGQLQNCVNHIERLKRHHPRETEKLEACVQSANKCLYETLCDATPPAAKINQQLLEALKHIMKMQTFGYIVLGEEATTKAKAAIAAAQGGGE